MWGHSRHGLTKDDLLFFAIAAVLILAVGATAWIALDVGISSLFSNRTSVMEGEVSVVRRSRFLASFEGSASS